MPLIFYHELSTQIWPYKKIYWFCGFFFGPFFNICQLLPQNLILEIRHNKEKYSSSNFIRGLQTKDISKANTMRTTLIANMDIYEIF